MILYHVTHGANSESISTKGLVPVCSDRGLTSKWKIKEEGWRQKVVWLTDDPDYILECQATPSFFENCIMLEVDCSSLEVEHRVGFYDDHEWLYYGIIPPECIKRVTPKEYPYS